MEDGGAAWSVHAEINARGTVATVTAKKKKKVEDSSG